MGSSQRGVDDVGMCRDGSTTISTELATFDGLDNRREVMVLLQRLGTDQHRADFISRLVRRSRSGFGGCQVKVVDGCDPVTAYFMLVGCCNELGVSINEAARLLETTVRRLL